MLGYPRSKVIDTQLRPRKSFGVVYTLRHQVFRKQRHSRGCGDRVYPGRSGDAENRGINPLATKKSQNLATGSITGIAVGHPGGHKLKNPITPRVWSQHTRGTVARSVTSPD